MGFDFNPILECHVGIITLFLGPENLFDDEFYGISVASGLSDPDDEDVAVERLTDSNEPHILLFFCHHNPIVLPPTSLGYFMFILYFWFIPFNPVVYGKVCLFLSSRISSDFVLTQKVVYSYNGT